MGNAVRYAACRQAGRIHVDQACTGHLLCVTINRAQLPTRLCEGGWGKGKDGGGDDDGEGGRGGVSEEGVDGDSSGLGCMAKHTDLAYLPPRRMVTMGLDRSVTACRDVRE